MSQGFIRNVDEGLFGQVLNAVLFEGPGKALGALGRAVNFLGEKVDNGIAMVGGSISNGLGSVTQGFGSNAPDMAVTRAPEISAPAVSVAQAHHVDMNDLCTFSAPTFGGCAVGGQDKGRF